MKAFPDNDELEVAATYASSGTREMDNVPDTRGATVNVHYSISYLPLERLPAAAGRRSRRVFPHGAQKIIRKKEMTNSLCATSTAGI